MIPATISVSDVHQKSVVPITVGELKEGETQTINTAPSKPDYTCVLLLLLRFSSYGTGRVFARLNICAFGRSAYTEPP